MHFERVQADFAYISLGDDMFDGCRILMRTNPNPNRRY